MKKSISGGVCATHGAKAKRCSFVGCTNQAKKGGVCWSHVAKAERCDAGSDGEIFMRHPQMNVSRAAASCRPTSLLASVMNTDFSDDDKIGAWIWKSSRMARIVSANKVGRYYDIE